ncbi:MAG: CatB-related O-acetyltransferase [Butyrivibrio sp.]|nr:CatB-related O-acetyltransferase [Butyrivibrio sp.]
MFTFDIPHEFTMNGNETVNTPEQFPLCFVGRGGYTGDVRLEAFLIGYEVRHLLYIGRYVSIGGKFVVFSDSDHDYRSVYTGCIPEYAQDDVNIRVKWGQATGHIVRKGMTVIGDDVWIGDGVTVMASVTIGSGAVIGAGSVVTKDVPPYTIWAGNPARQVGTRFPEDVADKLMKISWWEFDKEKLAAIREDMQGEVSNFADKYYDDAKVRFDRFAGLKEHEPGIKCNVTAFLDISTDFPTFIEVVESFYREERGTDNKLFLYYHPGNEKECDTIAVIREKIKGAPDVCNIEICGIDEADEEAAIAKADYFVVGRDVKNIDRIGYAQKYGVKLISGVDMPMFRKL